MSIVKNITDWFTRKPVTVVTPARYFLSVPAFSITTGSWEGSSLCVGQFNYAAASDFWITGSRAAPTGANFMLCVRWRKGDTVYRYRLWDDARFLGADVPAYLSQKIGANFVIEVWSYENETPAKMDNDWTVLTSLGIDITDLRSVSNTSIATGAQFTSIFNTNAIPSAPASGVLVATATTRVADFIFSGSGTNTNLPVVWSRVAGSGYTNDNWTINKAARLGTSSYPASCEGLRPIELNTYAADGSIYKSSGFDVFIDVGPNFVFQVIVNFKTLPVDSVEYTLLSIDTTGYGANWLTVTVVDGVMALKVEGLTRANETLRIGVDVFQTFTFVVSPTFCYIYQDDGKGGTDGLGTITDTQPNISNISFGGGGASVDAYFGVYQFWTGVATEAIRNSLSQYLNYVYRGSLPLPFTFEANSAWNDNPDYEDFV